MLPSIWYAQATEGLYLLTAVRGQHLNLRLVTQNFQEPNHFIVNFGLHDRHELFL